MILRPQSIRYACSISNSHMHPSNCKICDRIHPFMIQLYGGSSQPAASQPACTHPARSVILRRQSIRYACSISNSHMHPSNCKICDRIHPCMIQLYGGSSQPASQPASAASLSVTLIKIVDRSHYSPTAGSPRARPRPESIRCPPVAGPPWPPACRLSTPRPATESSGRRRQTAHSQ